MHVSDLASGQLANQHVRMRADGLCRAEDLVCLRMRPPTPSNRAAGYLCSQTRSRTSRRLKHDSMLFDKGKRLFGSHDGLRTGSRLEIGNDERMGGSGL